MFQYISPGSTTLSQVCSTQCLCEVCSAKYLCEVHCTLCSAVNPSAHNELYITTVQCTLQFTVQCGIHSVVALQWRAQCTYLVQQCRAHCNEVAEQCGSAAMLCINHLTCSLTPSNALLCFFSFKCGENDNDDDTVNSKKEYLCLCLYLYLSSYYSAFQLKV